MCSISTCRTHSEDYVHRIGRTGRAGRSGTAFTLVTGEDRKYLDQIETLIGTKIVWEGPGLDELPPAEERARPVARPRADPLAAGITIEVVVRRLRRAAAARACGAADSRRAPAPRPSEPDSRPPTYGDRRDRRPPRRAGGRRAAGVGLGDHIPSFLLRRVVLKPAKIGEE